MSKNTKLECVKEMLGDNISDLIANDLKEQYLELSDDLEKLRSGVDRCPIWSHNDKKEEKLILKMMKAIKRTYGWYSTKELDVEI